MYELQSTWYKKVFQKIQLEIPFIHCTWAIQVHGKHSTTKCCIFDSQYICNEDTRTTCTTAACRYDWVSTLNTYLLFADEIFSWSHNWRGRIYVPLVPNYVSFIKFPKYQKSQNTGTPVQQQHVCFFRALPNASRHVAYIVYHFKASDRSWACWTIGKYGCGISSFE